MEEVGQPASWQGYQRPVSGVVVVLVIGSTFPIPMCLCYPSQHVLVSVVEVMDVGQPAKRYFDHHLDDLTVVSPLRR